MKRYEIEKMTLKAYYEEAANDLYGKKLGTLTPAELNFVIAKVVKEHFIAPRLEEAFKNYSERKIAIYFSIEFLIGRIVLDALVNSGLKKYTTEIFDEAGIDINTLEEVEDAALGNGGLGRLAACFVESAATKGLPLYGVGIYYKYGLFKQFIIDGKQVERPDDWTVNGDPWFEPYYDEAQIVEYRDTKVKAVPCIMPVIGYNSNKKFCDSNAFPLTLWKAEAIPGETNESATAISDYLYPDDSNDDGKKLRLRQEYFFVSATLQMLIKKHLEKHGTLDNFEQYYSFQMNDTHPVIGCLEFIRLFEQNGYTFKQAFEKAKLVFNYTNHTIMAEALEKWPIIIFKDLLPKVFKVVEDMNYELIQELSAMSNFNTTRVVNNQVICEPNWQKIRNYELFADGLIHMSRIACFVSNKINGVAEVHSEIIKRETLHKWYELYPEKFTNKTNGVTPRRWIKLANPELAAFLDKYVGNNWVTHLSKLEKLAKQRNNIVVLKEFAAIKQVRKEQLRDYIMKKEGIEIDPDSIYDCQVKRIHEYKRQLMNGLRILWIYNKIKNGQLPNFYKTTFIIGGKAAPGYVRAKQIISLLKDIQEMVNSDPDVNQKMRVVFVENFNVSYGEKIYSAANISEQISTAGTEASGTGNMKFMMNGAVTLGTADGANIEIFDEVGSKNRYAFGATVDELERTKNLYRHQDFLKANPQLNEPLDYLKGKQHLKNEYWDILNTMYYDDHYHVLYDLQAYMEQTLRANEDYAAEQKDPRNMNFTRKELVNTAHSGGFSSDRTIKEYASEIWNIQHIAKPNEAVKKANQKTN